MRQICILMVFPSFLSCTFMLHSYTIPAQRDISVDYKNNMWLSNISANPSNDPHAVGRRGPSRPFPMLPDTI